MAYARYNAQRGSPPSLAGDKSSPFYAKPAIEVHDWKAVLQQCGLFTLFFALTAISIWLLWLGGQYSSSKCVVPLTTYARTDGALNLAAAASLLVVIGWWHLRIKPSSKSFMWPSSLGVAMLALCVLMAVVLSYLGVKIWGSVLLFGDSLWTRMNAPGVEASELPCSPSLYFPLSVYMILSWTAPVVLLSVAVCVGVAYFLSQVYQKALDKRDKGEPADPWAGFQGTPPPPFGEGGYADAGAYGREADVESSDGASGSRSAAGSYTNIDVSGTSSGSDLEQRASGRGSASGDGLSEHEMSGLRPPTAGASARRTAIF